ncbi:hypothetical protein [Streptomyces sp. RPT161]|uniref:hypothetical protein n=1 Tax=Streptomyces sp. RPT161 TaxID=3015993 RepID=UPI0022B8CDA0|nr:hypothetical protein [Streptomyces sp. RPT161]
MKNGTIRTLGAAALGVAFAAAAAGTASAADVAPSALPAVNPATALDGLTQKLPVQQATNLLPGVGTTVESAQGVLRGLSGPDGNGLLGGLKPGTLPISSVTDAVGAVGH